MIAYSSLPVTVCPRPEEFLLGLLLRADEANAFPAGTMATMTRRHDSGTWLYGRPSLAVLGTTFDLGGIGEYLDLPAAAVEGTTFRAELRRLFGDSVAARKLGVTGALRIGRVLATWEVLYRPRFPDLELAKWATSLYAWLTDPRNDVGRTRRVRMRYLAETVSAALAVASAEGRTGLRSDGMDLYNAALRITVRGLTYAILAADPGSESPSSAP